MKETKEKYPEKATDLSQLSDWRLFYSIWCTVVHLHKLFIQVTPTFNTHLFLYKTIFLLFNIFICYKIILKFFVLSVYLHGTVTILPTAREITHKKKQCIILESNRECANGLFNKISILFYILLQQDAGVFVNWVTLEVKFSKVHVSYYVDISSETSGSFLNRLKVFPLLIFCLIVLYTLKYGHIC